MRTAGSHQAATRKLVAPRVFTPATSSLRPVSNSLTELLVFGTRAGKAAAAFASHQGEPNPGRLVQDPAYIDSVLADGSDRARAIASETINAVKDIVGFIRH